MVSLVMEKADSWPSIVAHSIRVGGNRIDDAITTFMKRRHSLLIGERTAEELKIAVGSAVLMKEPLTTEVRGRDLVSGLPKNVVVTSNDVTEAIQEPLRLIVGAVRDVLEETPEFLQDTPDHDRLWFEQRPPRDFDFDG